MRVSRLGILTCWPFEVNVHRGVYCGKDPPEVFCLTQAVLTSSLIFASQHLSTGIWQGYNVNRSDNLIQASGKNLDETMVHAGKRRLKEQLRCAR